MQMDINLIAAAVVPYLVKCAEAFSKTTGEKAVGKVVELCQAIRTKFKGDSNAEQTLANAEKEPEAKGRQAALKEILIEKMKGDPSFAELVNKLEKELHALEIRSMLEVGDVRTGGKATGTKIKGFKNMRLNSEVRAGNIEGEITGVSLENGNDEGERSS
jgi:hypothetical protein